MPEHTDNYTLSDNNGQQQSGELPFSPENNQPQSSDNPAAAPDTNQQSPPSKDSENREKREFILNVIERVDGAGKTTYSTDGGKTWSDSPPDGFDEKPGTDGKR